MLVAALVAVLAHARRSINKAGLLLLIETINHADGFLIDARLRMTVFSKSLIVGFGNSDSNMSFSMKSLASSSSMDAM